MNININLQHEVTSEDSYELEYLAMLIEKECNLTVKQEKLESLSKVKDGGLTIGIAIASLALSAVGTFISVLAYWQSQKPRYSVSMTIGTQTYTIENISPQQIENIQTTIAQLQSSSTQSNILVNIYKQ
ncbi:MAG: hypothetical protein ACK4XH_05630 [Microcystis sp.]|jgi:hypothetical protein|uniref:hypothetical protein n=1 Tax=Microcystis TaxID=1125 RepID=UPI00232E07F2|nr:hypothetical protein [Microcystis aeruginosa]MDB9429747.1 hypothetical protein [Microcystis aeruginosa CS-555/01A07]